MSPEEYRESLSAGFGQAATAVRTLAGIVAVALLGAAVVWAAWLSGDSAAGLANRLLAYAQRGPVVGVGRATFWMTVSGVSVGVAAVGRAADPDGVRRWRGLRPAEAEEVVGNWVEETVGRMRARFQDGRLTPSRRRPRGPSRRKWS